MHERSLRSLQNTRQNMWNLKISWEHAPRSPNHNLYYGPHFCLFALDSLQSSQQPCYRHPLFWSRTTLANRVKFFLKVHSIFIASDNYYQILFLKFHNTGNLQHTVYQWELYQELIYTHQIYTTCTRYLWICSACMNSKIKHETPKWKFGQ